MCVCVCVCVCECVCVSVILFSVIICNCIYILHLTSMYSSTFGKGWVGAEELFVFFGMSVLR